MSHKIGNGILPKQPLRCQHRLGFANIQYQVITMVVSNDFVVGTQVEIQINHTEFAGEIDFNLNEIRGNGNKTIRLFVNVTV